MSDIILGLLAILFVMLIGFVTSIWQMHRNDKKREQCKRRGKTYCGEK